MSFSVEGAGDDDDFPSYVPSKLSAEEQLQMKAQRGLKVQRRAASLSLSIGLVLLVVGIGCDLLTGADLLGLPPKAANFFQPIWQCALVVALLGLLPNHRRGQLVVTFILIVLVAAAMALFTLFSLDVFTVICADDATNASAAAGATSTNASAEVGQTHETSYHGLSTCAKEAISISLYLLDAILCFCFLVPALLRRDGQFIMQPRQRLRRLWLAARVNITLFALNCLPFGVAAALLGEYVEAAANLTAGILELLLVVAFRPSARMHYHAMLFDKLHVDDQSRAAAMVAAMTGGTSAKAALRNAIEGFTVISFADLSPSDLRTNTAGSGHEKAAAAHEAAGGMPIVTKTPLEAAAARTRHVPLGGCDAFVSHSWSDDADHKFEQLSAWAHTFQSKHNRAPLLWIDKFSISQSAINEGLASLPVNLAGCSQLVCLCGPTYLFRLWCLLEIHTFAFMGGDTRSNLVVLPVSAGLGGGGKQQQPPGSSHVDSFNARSEAIERVRSFSLRDATCYDTADRAHLLEVIASGCGSHVAFERMLKSGLLDALGGRKRSNLTRMCTRATRQDSKPGLAVV